MARLVQLYGRSNIWITIYIYIYTMPFKGNLVYTKTITGVTTRTTQFTFDGISAKGNCLILVCNNYVSESSSIGDSSFELTQIKIGDKTASSSLTIVKDNYDNIIGYASTNVVFSDLTGVDTISFYIGKAANPTMKIYKL